MLRGFGLLKRLVFGGAKPRQAILGSDLVENGEFKPVIDRRYTFEEIVEAHRYVDTGRKKGNVVLMLGSDRLS